MPWFKDATGKPVWRDSAGPVMLPAAPKTRFEAPQAEATLGKTREEIEAIRKRNEIADRQQALEERQFEAQRAKGTAARRKDMEARKTRAITLVNDIHAMSRIERDILNGGSSPSATEVGPLGSALSYIPGTAASDLDKELEALKSSIARASLGQMRQESPTGGAVGALNKEELRMFQASRGSLDQSQSPDSFLANLRRARELTLTELERIAPPAAKRLRERFNPRDDDEEALVSKYMPRR